MKTFKRIQNLILLLLPIILIGIIPGPPVFAQQQHPIAVSAIITSNQNDYQFLLTADGSSTMQQNADITYIITYGTKESAGLETPIMLSVDFSNDSAPGGSHVVDYVIGSASNAYGGTLPVIDRLNRTITWNVANLPYGTIDQTVTFKLRTNENYIAPLLPSVSFITQASMSNQYVTMPVESVTKFYKYKPAPPGPTPTRGPAPTEPATITPTPPVARLRITDVAITSLTQEAATIAIKTNKAAKVKIRYGTSPTTLNQTLQGGQFATENGLNMTNLLPATHYYFQVAAFDSTGVSTISEVYTFTTADKSQPATLQGDIFVISSGGTIIASHSLTDSSSTVSYGLLPTGTDYKITFSTNHPASFNRVEAIIRNEQGVDRIVNLSSTDSQVFSASLTSGGSGTYRVFIRLLDAYGNVIEQQVTFLQILHPLQVLEKQTNTAIGDARVYLWVFNQSTHLYIPVTTITNPVFTDQLGIVSLLLTEGKYKVEASAFGYTTQTIAFTLGKDAGQTYPTIYLVQNLFDVSSMLKYLTNTLLDTFNATLTSIQSLTNSIRFFNSIATSALASTISLSYLLFTIRTAIRWKDLIPFFVFNIAVLNNVHKKAYLYGIITDEKHPLGGARVEAVDVKTGIVLAHAVTNKTGQFHIIKTFNKQYVKITVSKDGFAGRTLIAQPDREELLKIVLKHTQQSTQLAMSFKHISAEFFELVLVVSLLSELLLLANFGVAKILPFVVLSLLNLLLWLFYERRNIL